VQEYGPGMIKRVGRGGKGEKPGLRTRFARVVPAPIELTDWDAVEGKTTARKDSGKTDDGRLFPKE
jgi:DNA gyrase subunit A